MRKLIVAAVIGYALFVSSPVCIAQQPQPKRFTMQRFTVKGTRLFTGEELLKHLGLKAGASYTQQDLQDAANKLGSLGLFSQVNYRFNPDTAEFILTDNQNLLPLRFDNCVWITDEQVVAELKKQMPFFVGVVPEEGTLAEEVGKQFEAVLGEHGVKASVQYMPFVDHGTVQAMTYTIVDPRIEVASMKFTGASPKLTEALTNSVKGSLGKEYSRIFVSGLENGNLKPVLQENGYLRGQFGDPSVKLLTAPEEAIAKVELSVPVDEGPQYRIASLTMDAKDPIAAEAAKRLAAFKTGDVANMTVFRSELSKLGSAYVAKGYMGARVKAEPAFDDTAHTVSFAIEIVPGELYKLSNLEIKGLDDAATAKFRSVWKLNPGDAYDPTYVTTFLNKNASKLGFLNGAGLAWMQKIHDDTKTVDLQLFVRRPGTRDQ